MGNKNIFKTCQFCKYLLNEENGQGHCYCTFNTIRIRDRKYTDRACKYKELDYNKIGD